MHNAAVAAHGSCMFNLLDICSMRTVHILWQYSLAAVQCKPTVHGLIKCRQCCFINDMTLVAQSHVSCKPGFLLRCSAVANQQRVSDRTLLCQHAHILGCDGRIAYCNVQTACYVALARNALRSSGKLSLSHEHNFLTSLQSPEHVYSRKLYAYTFTWTWLSGVVYSKRPELVTSLALGYSH